MENNEVNPQEQINENEAVVENAEENAAQNVAAEVPEAAPVEKAPAMEEVREEVRNKRAPLSSDEEAELAAAIGDVDLDAAMQSVAAPVALDVNAKVSAKVSQVTDDHVFVELPGNVPGILAKPENAPEVGAELEVVITKEPGEEGLYEVNLPGATVAVEDWSSVEKGMMVEAIITGHNTGGLECQVNNLRGFIPFNQIAAYRVENPAEFVGQKLECLVTEVNPARKNLVLSRRKVLDRERGAQRDQLFQQLQPGQIYTGIVRKIMDFGAFVDIGGIDGLLHISQLSWERVKHPSDVLHEGQEIQVQVEKLDPVTKKISFAYRTLLGNPWDKAEEKYPVGATVTGKVTKIMQFGAFVELEKSVEGLVHISEISHQRIGRVQDVLNIGDTVTVKILSVDRRARRIGLSVKALTEAPAHEDRKDDRQDRPHEEMRPKGGRPRGGNGPLRGGIGNPFGPRD